MTSDTPQAAYSRAVEAAETAISDMAQLDAAIDTLSARIRDSGGVDLESADKLSAARQARIGAQSRHAAALEAQQHAADWANSPTEAARTFAAGQYGGMTAEELYASAGPGGRNDVNAAADSPAAL